MRYWLVIALVASRTYVGAQHVAVEGDLLSHPCDVDSSSVFSIVEQMPSFPGGEAELFRYFGKAITYPKCEGVEVPSSTVHLSFIVRYDGAVCDAMVLSGSDCEGAEQEWIAMLSKMPKWIPGKQRGEPVNVRYTMPVRIHWK